MHTIVFKKLDLQVKGKEYLWTLTDVRVNVPECMCICPLVYF